MQGSSVYNIRSSWWRSKGKETCCVFLSSLVFLMYACMCLCVHVCVCVHSPFGESFLCAENLLDIASFIIVPSLPTRNLSLSKWVWPAWYYTTSKKWGARLAHRSGELHSGTVRGTRPQSLQSCPLSPFFTCPLSHLLHPPYPGPSCSLQSCHYSPSPRFHSGPLSWWWPLVTVGVCWMARSKLQGEHVRMSYFYNPVVQAYDFEDNKLKDHKYNPKELSFPLQSSAGLWAMYAQNLAQPGIGVLVTSFLAGWAPTEPLAPYRTLCPANTQCPPLMYNRPPAPRLQTSAGVSQLCSQHFWLGW